MKILILILAVISILGISYFIYDQTKQEEYVNNPTLEAIIETNNKLIEQESKKTKKLRREVKMMQLRENEMLRTFKKIINENDSINKKRDTVILSNDELKREFSKWTPITIK